MGRIRGIVGVGAAIASIAVFNLPARGAPSRDVGPPPAADAGVSHRAVCVPVPSAQARCHAEVVTGRDGVTPLASSSYPAGAYGPGQLQGAYGLAGRGAPAGTTVAIVDAYAEPNILSDLKSYRDAVGLTQLCSTLVTTNCSGTFTVVNQSGGTSLPRGDVGWGQEIALDVEMVSAVCPNCNILLVEANSNYFSDLTAAVRYAKGVAGVAAVSNSYGGGEFSGETTYDSSYAPASANQVVTVSSGDSGYGVEYPAASTKVVAVGGTSLSVSQVSPGVYARSSETAWSGAGSGCSAYEQQPVWQTNLGRSGCSRRLVADVSADANPSTGVAVYDSYGSSGGANWYVFGGTSVASPIVASVYALGGGGSTANTYANASLLFDVTSGSNGRCTKGKSGVGTAYLCTAGSGYDGPTGLGTPNGSLAPF